MGQHEIRRQNFKSYYWIPIIDAKAPPHGGLSKRHLNSHDFALMILKHPAKFSNKVAPICLPKPNDKFSGETAVAAGWGRYAAPHISQNQSTYLRKVYLTVSSKVYKHKFMFGTKLDWNGEVYKDACSGDSGALLNN